MVKILLLLGLFAFVTSRGCQRECQTLSVQCHEGEYWCSREWQGDYHFTSTSIYGRRAWQHLHDTVLWRSERSDTWMLGGYYEFSWNQERQENAFPVRGNHRPGNYNYTYIYQPI